MGAIMSSNPVIGQIRLVDVSSKVPKTVLAIRQGTHVFLKYSDNEFAVCRLISTEKWAFPMSLRSWPWQGAFIDALVKLKLLPKSVGDEHKAFLMKRMEDDQRAFDLEQIKELSKKWGLTVVGFTIPKKQSKKLKGKNKK